jgi:hypothetical protein
MHRFLALIVLGLTTQRLAAQARSPNDPATGTAVLERMHAAYAGRWYTMLAFVQKTTFMKPGGERDTATWYESFKGPDNMRIDFGDPRAGRGILFTAESSFAFREGQRARAGAEGNPFLPLVMGVYLQPVAATVRGASHHGFDVTKAHRAAWDGRPVYVVGAATPADSTAPQFWVDADRLVVVRVRVPMRSGAGLLDIRLDGYVPLGGGWLATRVSIAFEGKPLQLEEYTEWSDGVAIPDSLFERARWVSGGHWAGGPRSAPLWHRAQN